MGSLSVDDLNRTPTQKRKGRKRPQKKPETRSNQNSSPSLDYAQRTLSDGVGDRHLETSVSCFVLFCVLLRASRFCVEVGFSEVKIFYTDHYVLPLPPWHRFPMLKYALLRERVEQARLAGQPLSVPEAASDEQLLQAHSTGYLERVKSG